MFRFTSRTPRSDIFGWRDKLAAGLFVVALAHATTSWAAIPLDQWTYSLVSSDHIATFGLEFGDIDRDGLTDIVSGPFWYRNPGGDLLGAWTQNPFPSGMRAFAVTDVDGDDRTDVMAQKSETNLSIYWLEATNAGSTTWSAVYMGDVPSASHPEGAQGYQVGQIETGGDPEVAIGSGNGIYYFRMPVTPDAGNWPRVHVNAAPSDEGFSLGDIDRDGQLDIAATTGDAKGVVWYRNPGNGTGTWQGRQLATFAEAVFPDRTELADLNADGRLDVVVTEENGLVDDASTIWWEQPVDVFTGTWTAHTVVIQGTTNSLDVADLDQDGDIDVILAEHRGSRKLAVWSNDGIGGLTEHVVSSGIESHLGARTVDLDGDGDLDIVSIAWDAFQNVHLWRNDNGGGTSGVANEEGTPPGRLLTALEAWPNPFNPTVELNLGLQRTSPVRVEIYALSGRLVRRLFDGTPANRSLRLVWNGNDESGRHQASGVYLVQAIAGSDRRSARLVLLK